MKNITYLLLIILTLLLIKHYRHIALAVIYDDNETKTIRNRLIGDWTLVKKQGFSDNSIKTKENLSEVTYFKYFSRGSNDFIPDPYIIKPYNSTSEIKYFRNRVFFVDPYDAKAQINLEIARLTKDSLILVDPNSKDVVRRKNESVIPKGYVYIRKNK